MSWHSIYVGGGWPGRNDTKEDIDNYERAIRLRKNKEKYTPVTHRGITVGYGCLQEKKVRTVTFDKVTQLSFCNRKMIGWRVVHRINGITTVERAYADSESKCEKDG